jgi:uncharacterized protein (TIGR02001 family)
VSATAPRARILRRHSTHRVALAGLVLACASPAAAEFGATASVWSQERLRGYSLSADHPTARLDLSYDDPSGFYGALSGSLAYSSEYDLYPLGLQENVGFAKQLGSGPTIDVGIHNSNYFKHSSRESAGYTEAYAGLIGKVLSGRLYVSPNYFHSNTWRAYGEVEAGIRPLPKLLLSAHAGLLVPLNDRDYGRSAAGSRAEYDWRIGAEQELGRVSLHLDLSGGGPGKDWYEGKAHNRTALVAGASFLF